MQEGVQGAQFKRAHGSVVKSLQAYHVDVPSAANAKHISVVSYSAREGMASPYEITIEFTHPELLSRADYLGRDGHFTITAEDSTQPRIYCGIIVKFKRIKKTKDFFSYSIVITSQMKRLRVHPKSTFHLALYIGR
jgi:type VI secretion system secreted protein VgrG